MPEISNGSAARAEYRLVNALHLRKDRIEAAQAAESRQQRNLDHWQFGIIQKPLRPLHACRLGNLTGAGAEMFVE
jgi:hypothetical protein